MESNFLKGTNKKSSLLKRGKSIKDSTDLGTHIVQNVNSMFTLSHATYEDPIIMPDAILKDLDNKSQ